MQNRYPSRLSETQSLSSVIEITHEQRTLYPTLHVEVVKATYKLRKNNPAVTEVQGMPGRGHSLSIDVDSVK